MASCCKIFNVILLALGLIIGIMFFRAEVYFPNVPLSDRCNQTHEPIGGQAILDRFTQALKIKTITRDRNLYDPEALIEFGKFLRKSFPTIYSSPIVQVETVNNYSLLYTVKGSDPTLKPYLLCSHMDVVSVELDKWTYPPFGGVISDDGFIYGRGTIDVKNTLMSIMESLEYLLNHGFKPKRSFYIAFGHDEEGLGIDGAQEIAKTFVKKGIKEFEFLLDEGMTILQNQFPGVSSNVAIIGVSEKGFVSLNLKSKGEVGHSSMPPEDTVITKLARAVSKITGTSHKNLFGLGPEKVMLETFATKASYPFKLVYSNLWVFGPIVSRFFSQSPSGNGFVRTTSAVTIFNSGFKENVLPGSAEAVVNHRIHPIQTVEEVIEYDKYLIDDPSIEIEIKGNDFIKAHPISPYGSDSFGYNTIKKSIDQVFDNVLTTPGIFLATTDTRWYLKFTKSVYRFSPSVMMNKEDMKRFHGHNERISVDNYLKTVNFYHHIMMNSDKPKLDIDYTVKDEL
ncbi:hypothetical protein RDWZM_000226 [Blomia tropicalis]|uniref:Peptidase M20 dimerisation domain-containing protein n=1 Tax=Blomia tropicalis TaxID=40697 RepID=A0A9Q0RQ94_BLOTA|nr:hypothetical protein BLOT_015487 [Blomia tropicalis]KAJ6221681.1 hypothetical protein RDWZM_000226 [Blomia tropicalis]